MSTTALQKLRFKIRLIAALAQISILHLIFPIPGIVFVPSVIATVTIGILLQYKLVYPLLSIARNGPERLAYSKLVSAVGKNAMLGAVIALIVSVFENGPEQISQSAIVGNAIFVIGLAIYQSSQYEYARFEENRNQTTTSEGSS